MKKVFFTFCFLFLIVSPWFVQLLLSGVEWWGIKSLTLDVSVVLENLITNSSIDYLFFKGDPRSAFGTQETGPFYICQIPLILVGFYLIFQKTTFWRKVLLVWFGLGVLLASLFVGTPDFSNGLFYFLPLQFISFLGLNKLIDHWKKGKILTKIFLIFFSFFSLYEMIIFFHIIIVHYPKRL